MFKALFNIMIDIMGSLIQIVTWPINAVITATLPDLNGQIAELTTSLTDIFSNISWALGLIPGSVVNALLFILSCEIAKHVIFVAIHGTVDVWVLFSKIKFW